MNLFRRHRPEYVSMLSTRARFHVDSELERKADLARAAMGDAHLLAKPVERKRDPLDYADLGVIE